MTNANKIRGMSDEQLAEWFSTYFPCGECSMICGDDQECSKIDCIKGALEYLKSEVDDEH